MDEEEEKMTDNSLYIEIYGKIYRLLNEILDECVNDQDKAYEAAMSLLMISMKMHMFAGITKENLPFLHNNIDQTFEKVYRDFESVDLNKKD
jgi:hypothetical protein